MNKKEEFLNEELQTKSEFRMTVWADTHKSTWDCIGAGKMCLKEINGQLYEDKEFIDPITKEKTVYQARVYTGKVKLKSEIFCP